MNFSHNALALSRPYSIPCYFEGEILDYEVIKPDFEYKLTVYFTTLSNESMCNKFQEKTVDGSWYPPTAKLPSGKLYKPDQPVVAVEQVLVKGVKIKGYVDSYDSIIEKVEVIEAGIVDNEEINQARQQDNVLNKGQIINILVGIALILIVGIIYLMWKNLDNRLVLLHLEILIYLSLFL